MSQRNPIKLFVSHSWEENEDYHRVFEYLESDSNFYYQNYSSPDRPPNTAEREALREDLRKQIAPTEIVIVLNSFCRQNADMAMFQMNFAKAADKPVIVLESYGTQMPIPKAIKDVADEVVSWDKRSLIDAIRRQARHEDTQRWDTIEFKIDDLKFD